jgi:hypothetical protein
MYLNWVFWGGLMAVATDVGMIVSAKRIRNYADRHNKGILVGFRNQPLHLWGAYLAAVVGSSLGQIYFAAAHAAPLVVQDAGIPILAPGGWLYSVLQYRILILPLLLPVMSFLYTIAQRGEVATTYAPQAVSKQTGDEVWTVREAAKMANLTESRIRQIAGANGNDIGTKNGNRWEFNQDDIRRIMEGDY